MPKALTLCIASGLLITASAPLSVPPSMPLSETLATKNDSLIEWRAFSAAEYSIIDGKVYFFEGMILGKHPRDALARRMYETAKNMYMYQLFKEGQRLREQNSQRKNDFLWQNPTSPKMRRGDSSI